MNFGDLLTDVYRITNDPGQIVWSNKVVALHTRRGLQRIGQTLGDSLRISLALVQSQTEYPLPANVRSVKKVQIIPEEGAALGTPLIQVDSEKLPVETLTETDPTNFALSATGGTNNQNFSLNMWPAPARSTADAIVIDVENAYDDVVSDDPATAPQLAFELPFPGSFDLVLLYLVAGSLLTERTDAAEMQRGIDFATIAENQLRDLAPIDTAQYMIDIDRAFP